MARKDEDLDPLKPPEHDRRAFLRRAGRVLGGLAVGAGLRGMRQANSAGQDEARAKGVELEAALRVRAAHRDQDLERVHSG